MPAVTPPPRPRPPKPPKPAGKPGQKVTPRYMITDFASI